MKVAQGQETDVAVETSEEEKISRRTMIAKGAAVAAGAMAASIGGGAMPQVAGAADGDTVKVAQPATNNPPGPVPQLPAIWGVSVNAAPGVHGEGTAYGVVGASNAGNAVYGQSTSGRGVYGKSTSGPGVYGASTNEDGVVGKATSNVKSGVYGEHLWSGWGVYGTSVYGIGTTGVSTNGIGMKAASPEGVALQVQGVAKFSQSGRAIVSSGSTERLVNGAKVGTGSAILVTLNADAGPGVYVKYAVRTTATQFRIVFSAATTKATTASWFVLNA